MNDNINGMNQLDKHIDRLKELIKNLFFIAITVLVVKSVIHPVVVDGASMDKTLYDGERLFVNKIYNTIEYKDIIVFKSDLYDELLVKRVIGVGGDSIEIIDNKLYINDKLVQEDYINGPMYTNDYSVVVPEGYLFVMGDNRNISLDSRDPSIGLIDSEEVVIGKIIGVK